MTNMRNEIAAIVWLHKDYSEGYNAEARIDKLERHLAAVIARYDTYRDDEYEVGLSGVDAAIHHARAALKGTYT